MSGAGQELGQVKSHAIPAIRLARSLTALTVLLSLTACIGGGGKTTAPPTTATATGSIIPGTDGAPAGNVDVSGLSDAIPKVEPVTRAGNKNPYTVFGKTYHLLPVGSAYREVGTASWYGTKFHGRKTANGETYDMYGMSAAHKTLPIPSYVKVTNLDNQRSAIVRVNDRGPFHGDRIIDLSYAAAKKLGYAGPGTARVQVEAVDPGAYQANTVESPRLVSSEQTSAVFPATLVPAVSTPSADGYRLPGNTFLQVGAFASLNAAETLQSRVATVTARPTSIREALNASGKLFRVLVGPFSSTIQLRNIRESLIQAERLEPFVVYDSLQ